MSKVIHTIKGIRYLYEHTRVNGCVVCKYLGPVDGSRQRTSSPKLSEATRTKDIAGRVIYASQKDLDNEVRDAYTRGKLGISRIQKEIFGQIGLSPSRRGIENYIVDDLGLVLRKRTQKAKMDNRAPTDSELLQAKERLAMTEIENGSKNRQIDQMRDASTNDAKEILRLKEKLMDFRDMGRAPTDAEIEEIV